MVDIKQTIKEKNRLLIDTVCKISIDMWKYNYELRPPDHRQREGYITLHNGLYIYIHCREGAWRPFIKINGIEIFDPTDCLDDFSNSIKKYWSEKQENEDLKNINNILDILKNGN